MKPQTIARWVLVGMLLAAFMLRAPITAVPPVLKAIAEDLALNPTAAGFVSTLPLLCFGVFAFVTPFLSAKLGVEPTLWVAVLLLIVGIGVRLVVDVGPFFMGTLLIGLGVAIGNVIVPALARTWFATRLAFVMGLYSVTLQMSGALGPLVTSIGVGTGLSWSTSIGFWLIPAIIALLVWSIVSLIVRRQTHNQPHKGAQPTGLRHVARTRLAWIITFVMGVQSLLFYSLLTWLPTQFREIGATDTQAGLMLTAFTLLGFPGSFMAKFVTVHPRAPRNLIVMFSIYWVGLILLWIGLPVTVLTGAVIAGLGQGICLAMALTFIAHQSNPADVPATSALAQGVGYLIAATGPVLVGFLYDRTGSLQLGEFILVILTVPLTIGAVYVARSIRPRRDEVEV
ncbi:MFS transporter [Granulicoccus sp. GXG6511]|uniref:MFS transporter n=1 Tax=Granulicoccus sp. GXG6511 TaxID=3381351 RepID=UPI003D7CCA45